MHRQRVARPGHRSICSSASSPACCGAAASAGKHFRAKRKRIRFAVACVGYFKHHHLQCSMRHVSLRRSLLQRRNKSQHTWSRSRMLVASTVQHPLSNNGRVHTDSALFSALPLSKHVREKCEVITLSTCGCSCSSGKNNSESICRCLDPFHAAQRAAVPVTRHPC